MFDHQALSSSLRTSGTSQTSLHVEPNKTLESIDSQQKANMSHSADAHSDVKVVDTCGNKGSSNDADEQDENNAPAADDSLEVQQGNQTHNSSSLLRSTKSTNAVHSQGQQSKRNFAQQQRLLRNGQTVQGGSSVLGNTPTERVRAAYAIAGSSTATGRSHVKSEYEGHGTGNCVTRANVEEDDNEVPRTSENEAKFKSVNQFATFLDQKAFAHEVHSSTREDGGTRSIHGDSSFAETSLPQESIDGENENDPSSHEALQNGCEVQKETAESSGFPTHCVDAYRHSGKTELHGISKPWFKLGSAITSQDNDYKEKKVTQQIPKSIRQDEFATENAEDGTKECSDNIAHENEDNQRTLEQSTVDEEPMTTAEVNNKDDRIGGFHVADSDYGNASPTGSPTSMERAHAHSLRTRREQNNQAADSGGSTRRWEVKNRGKSAKKRHAPAALKQADELHASGYRLRKQGRLEEAKEMYSKALELEPWHFKALFNRGFTNDKLELHEEALVDYNAALQVDPSNSFTYYNRGIANDKLGRHDAAIDDFTSAIASDSANPDFYHNRGFSYRKRGKLLDAIRDYSEAIRLAPEHCRALYNRAFVYERLGKWKESVEDYTLALEIDYANPVAYYNRALARERCGDVGGALNDHNKAIELSEADSAGQLYAARGCLKERLGNVEGALVDYSEALQREPSSANALRCSAAAARQRGEYREALDLFWRLNQVEPNDPTPLIGQGDCHRRLDELQQAIALFQRALEVDEHCTSAYLQMAWCLARIGQSLEAADAYTRALELEKSRQQSGALTSAALHALHNRAIVKQRAGYLESALEDMRRVIDGTREDHSKAVALSNRASIFERQEQPGDALQDYKSAVHLLQREGNSDELLSRLRGRIEQLDGRLKGETEQSQAALSPMSPSQQLDVK